MLSGEPSDLSGFHIAPEREGPKARQEARPLRTYALLALLIEGAVTSAALLRRRGLYANWLPAFT